MARDRLWKRLENPISWSEALVTVGIHSLSSASGLSRALKTEVLTGLVGGAARSLCTGSFALAGEVSRERGKKGTEAEVREEAQEPLRLKPLSRTQEQEDSV